MPTFNYKAKSAPQNTVAGKIEAESEQDAVSKITKLGYFPILVRPEGFSEKEEALRLRKISNRDLLLFTRQLATLIESGVNIITALSIISNQTGNKYLKTILTDVSGRIKDGKSLSDSLGAHPRLFSDLYSAMIRTGEASGNLSIVLSRLAEFSEKQEEFKNSLRASLTYPFFVIGVGAMTVMVLLIFVVPRLVVMFEDMGQILPLPTRILISTSSFLKNYWWIILAAIAILLFFLRRILRSGQARSEFDRIKLKLLLFGPIVLKSEISRLMRTLSLLLSSGVSITLALEISASVVDNQNLKSEVKKIKEKIGAGASFSGSLKESRMAPDFVTNIVAIGEESGALEKALLRIGDEYERDIDRSLKTLMRLLEPVIILVMGLIVGFIVLSMLLPIFQINLIAK